MSALFHHAVLGGTFDHFHLGHQAFITAACTSSAKLTLGLTQTPVRNKKLSHLIEPYSKRHQSIMKFVHDHRYSNIDIIPINDIYGTTLTDLSLDAIFVTQETYPGAQEVNQKRDTRSLPALQIITVPHVCGDDQKVINSTRIREGLINRKGISYLKFIQSRPNFSLPPALRERLRTPLGSAVNSVAGLSHLIPHGSLIITVGDIVTHHLLNTPYHPKVSIIDHHSKRRPIRLLSHLTATLFLDNPQSTINSAFGKLFLTALNQPSPQTIIVHGEEDLLALPTILLAPLNSFVIYGQNDLGMVVTRVTENQKEKAVKLLQLM